MKECISEILLVICRVWPVELEFVGIFKIYLTVFEIEAIQVLGFLGCFTVKIIFVFC